MPMFRDESVRELLVWLAASGLMAAVVALVVR